MGNLYFHEFTPGFNWWYVIVPLVAVAVFAIAYNSIRYGLSERRRQGRICRIFRGYDTKTWLGVSAVIGVIIGAWVMVESGAGIIQWLDNGLVGAESPANSVIGAGLVGGGIALGVAAILFLLAEAGMRLRRQHIRRKFEGGYEVIDHNDRPRGRQVNAEIAPINSATLPPTTGDKAA